MSFDPAMLALIGVGISAGLSAIGSSLGSGVVAKTSAALLSKQPEKFAQVLILSALPSSQALYGFLYGIIILLQTGLLSGSLKSTVNEAIGWQFLFSALPVGIACLFSGYYQGVVAASGVKIVAESPENSNQGVVLAALIETFAIFGLIMSILIAFVGIKV